MSELITPENLEAERAVISMMMHLPSCIVDVSDKLTGRMFNDPPNAVIFDAITEMDENGLDISPRMLVAYLKNKSSLMPDMTMLQIVGGEEAVLELTQDQDLQNVDYFVDLVWKTFIQRRIIRAGTELVRIGYSNDYSVEDMLGLAERHVYEIREGDRRSDTVTAKEAVAAYWKHMQEQIADPGKVRGIRFGLPNLDSIIGEVDPGRLVALAGRPGFGKTTTALYIANQLAIQRGKPVLYVSYEQDEFEHTRSLVAMLTGIDSMKLKYPNRLPEDDIHQVQTALARIEQSPLEFTSMGDAVQIRTKARRMNAKSLATLNEPLAMVVVDYLQLMPSLKGTRANTRDQEIGEISRYLKLTAKELNTVVLLLSQLNREAERRSDHRPLLSDLRESGNIEQDSDLVIFAFCPEAYMNDAQRRAAYLGGSFVGFETYDHIVSKWRAGRTGTAHNAWKKSCGHIVSLVDV